MKAGKSNVTRKRTSKRSATDYDRLTAALRYFDAVDPRYLSALDNYVATASRWILSERTQGVKRLKAYADFALDCYATKTYPDFRGMNSNKYRILRPLLRMLHQAQDESNLAAVRLIFTVLRVHNLNVLSRSELLTNLADWLDRYTACYEEPSLFSNVQEEIEEEPSSIDKLLGRKPKVTVQTVRRLNQLIPCPEVSYRDDLKRLCPHLDVVSLESFLRAVTPDLLKFAKRVEPEQLAMLKLTASSSVQLDKEGVRHSLPSMVAAEYEGIALNLPEFNELKNLILQLADLSQELMSPFSQSFTIVDPTHGKSETDRRKILADARIDIQALRTFELNNPPDKARVVTTGMYSLQYALSLLHDYLMGLLRSLPYDYAESHEKGFAALQEASATKSYVACYDLHAATDEFPAAATALMFEHLFGSKYAKLWYTAMRLPSMVIGDDRKDILTVTFTKGQPMGLLSSWAAFSLSHHLVIGYAYWLAHNRKNWLFCRDKLLYGIVGDDNFITDAPTAQKYTAIMSELTVAINEEKSRTLERTQHRLITEFCKRTSDGGNEISGINPRSLVNATKGYSGLYELNYLIDQRNMDMRLSLDVRHIERSRRLLGHFQGKRVPQNEYRFGLTIPIEMGGLARLDSSSANEQTNHASFVRLAVLAYYHAKSLGKLHSRGRMSSTYAGHSKGIDDNKVQAAFRNLPSSIDISRSRFADYQRKLQKTDTVTDLESWSHIQRAIDDFTNEVILLIEDYSNGELDFDVFAIIELVDAYKHLNGVFKEWGVVPFYDLREALAAASENSIKNSMKLLRRHATDMDLLKLYSKNIAVASASPEASKLGRTEYEDLFSEYFGDAPNEEPDPSAMLITDESQAYGDLENPYPGSLPSIEGYDLSVFPPSLLEAANSADHETALRARTTILEVLEGSGVI